MKYLKLPREETVAQPRLRSNHWKEFFIARSRSGNAENWEINSEGSRADVISIESNLFPCCEAAITEENSVDKQKHKRAEGRWMTSRDKPYTGVVLVSRQWFPFFPCLFFSYPHWKVERENILTQRYFHGNLFSRLKFKYIYIYWITSISVNHLQCSAHRIILHKLILYSL